MEPHTDMKRRYQKIEDLSAKLTDWMESNKAQLPEFRTKFEMSYIYHENALEGVVVTAQELSGALFNMDEDESPDAVPIYQEIRTLKKAIDYLKEELRAESPAITLKMILRLHAILCPPVEYTGKNAPKQPASETDYRQEEQLGHRSYLHEIAPPAEIPRRMEEFIRELSSEDFREMHTIDQAAHAHWQLMRIFPFTERTGKIARLIANFILISRGYEPMVIHATDRQRYYDALRISEEHLRVLLAPQQRLRGR